MRSSCPLGYRRRSPSPSRRRSGDTSPPARYHKRASVDTAGRWLHDKFAELEGGPTDDGAADNVKQSSTVPKPVPAPKPILWSTIGREIVNGEAKGAASSTRSTGAIHKEGEGSGVDSSVDGSTMHHGGGGGDLDDVRSDAEPIIDIGVDQL